MNVTNFVSHNCANLTKLTMNIHIHGVKKRDNFERVIIVCMAQCMDQ